jgi:hypothetical protein
MYSCSGFGSVVWTDEKKSEWVSEWLLFNDKSAIVQL